MIKKCILTTGLIISNLRVKNLNEVACTYNYKLNAYKCFVLNMLLDNINSLTAKQTVKLNAYKCFLLNMFLDNIKSLTIIPQNGSGVHLQLLLSAWCPS